MYVIAVAVSKKLSNTFLKLHTHITVLLCDDVLLCDHALNVCAILYALPVNAGLTS